MGKIYRIPLIKYASWIDPVYRGYVLFFGLMAFIISMILDREALSHSGNLAIIILATPIIVIGVVGAYWETYPRIVPLAIRLTSGIGFVFTLIGIYLVLREISGEIYEYGCPYGPRYCEGIAWYLDLKTDISNLFLEFLPWLLNLLVFGCAFIATGKVKPVDT